MRYKIFHVAAANMGLLVGLEKALVQYAGADSPLPSRIVPTSSGSMLGIVAGPETTGLIAPLRDDGTVDMVAALNEIYGRGVTLENNAAVPLLELLDTANSSEAERVYQLLGIKEKPAARGLLRAAVELQAPDLGKVIEADGFSRAMTDAEREARPDWQTYERECQRFIGVQGNPWKAADFPEVAAWLKANEKALQLLDEACARPRFWYPLVVCDPKGPPLMSVGELHPMAIREGGNLLRSRAMLKLGNGDAAGCWADLRGTMRLARVLEEDPQKLTYIMSTELAGATCPVLCMLVQKGHMGGPALRAMLAEILSWGPGATPEEIDRRMTFYTYVDCVRDVALNYDRSLGGKRTELEKAFGVAGLPVPDWNRMLRLGKRFYDDGCGPTEGLSEAELTDRKQRFEKLRAAVDKTGDEVKMDPIGLGKSQESLNQFLLPREKETQAEFSDRLAMYLLSATYDLEEPRTWEVAKRRWSVTAIACGLAVYKAEHAVYPETLNALVPGVLAQLPVGSALRPMNYQRVGGGYRLASEKPESSATTVPATTPTRKDSMGFVVTFDE